jgi:hypothetical protein
MCSMPVVPGFFAIVPQLGEGAIRRSAVPEREGSHLALETGVPPVDKWFAPWAASYSTVMVAFFASLRRAISWHRRLLAFVVAAVGVFVVVSAFLPVAHDSVRAVVAVREIPAGQALVAADVEVRDLPRGAVPDGWTADAQSLIGGVAIAPIPRGGVVTPSAILTPGAADPAAGKVIMPIRLGAEGLDAMLVPGARIDLVGFDPVSGAAAVLAENVRIVTVPPASGGSQFGGGGDGITVLIEVEAGLAPVLATAASANLTVLLR